MLGRNDLPEDQAIFTMASTQGWGIVKTYLETNIETLKKELETSKFENLSEVTGIQREILGFRKILAFVEKRVKKNKEG